MPQGKPDDANEAGPAHVEYEWHYPIGGRPYQTVKRPANYWLNYVRPNREETFPRRLESIQARQVRRETRKMIERKILAWGLLIIVTVLGGMWWAIVEAWK